MIARSALGGALIILTSALAQGADLTAGLKSARSLCVNCHIVESGAPRQAELTADIPSFKAIAEKSGQTEYKLKVFMLNPHPPMPNVQLTTHELDNLASYIMSLKGQN
jgi:cytochrome c